MPTVPHDPSLITTRGLAKEYATRKYPEGPLGWLKGLVQPELVRHIGLHSLDMNLEPGEILGVLGPNGAGKSTLIKLLTGIQTPTAGEISVLGYRPSDRSRAFLKKIGVVFGHKSSLWWDLPVRTSLDSVRKIYEVEQSRYQGRLEELTHALGLSAALLERPVRVLSLGERVKCEVLAALLHDPKLLFLDEPTVGLDITSRTELRALLRSYAHEYRIGVILTSHDVGDIETCCSRVMLINRGAVAFNGKIDTLKATLSDGVRLRIKANDFGFSPQEINEISMHLSGFSSSPGDFKVTPELIEITLPKELSRKAIGAIINTDLNASIELRAPDLEEVLLQHFRSFKEHPQS